MKQCFELSYTARLHLQPVVSACNKAILRFGNPIHCYNNQKFLLSTSCQNTVYAWLDNKLFSGALAIVFLFLMKNSEPQSPIILTLRKIERNTCRLLISTGGIDPFDKCAEPVSLTSIGLDITELESFQYIMDMHGSCMQLWRYPDTLAYAFGIDILCICEEKVFL